jgi:hypothetical protein
MPHRRDRSGALAAGNRCSAPCARNDGRRCRAGRSDCAAVTGGGLHPPRKTAGLRASTRVLLHPVAGSCARRVCS